MKTTAAFNNKRGNIDDIDEYSDEEIYKSNQLAAGRKDVDHRKKIKLNNVELPPLSREAVLPEGVTVTKNGWQRCLL